MAIVRTRFDQISEQATELLNAEHIDFFSSYSWYKNWVDSKLLDEDERIEFFHFLKDGELKLLVPLKARESSFESLTNYYSPLYALLSKTCDEKIFFLDGFFKELKYTSFKWESLLFRPMDQQEVELLRSRLKNVGLVSIPFFCFANWYLEVKHRSFDEYFSGLSSRVKNTVLRKTKQFKQLDGTRIEIVFEGDKLCNGMKDFKKVYEQSWKNEETYPAFISGLMASASDNKALRLGIAYIDDVAIAAQLWIVADNCAYIYKLAYDEKYKKLSIGSVLTATLMRHVIDIDKVEKVDYLSGDDAYKKEWMSDRKERWGIIIFNSRSFNGLLKMVNELTRFYFKKYFVR